MQGTVETCSASLHFEFSTVQCDCVTVDGEGTLSYLPWGFGLVIVVAAGGQVDILMNSVQKPKQELQGVMLGVSSELGSILGYYTLERERRVTWSMKESM